MNEPTAKPVSWDRFTDAQRRRAEALLLARLLFPLAAPGYSQMAIARWVTTGRTEPRSTR